MAGVRLLHRSQNHALMNFIAGQAGRMLAAVPCSHVRSHPCQRPIVPGPTSRFKVYQVQESNRAGAGRQRFHSSIRVHASMPRLTTRRQGQSSLLLEPAQITPTLHAV